jgi:hypothetical protein
LCVFVVFAAESSSEAVANLIFISMQLERMYLKKAGSDADKAEQIRRMHEDFAQEKATLLHAARLEASKDASDSRARDALVRRLEKELSDAKRKVSCAYFF